MNPFRFLSDKLFPRKLAVDHSHVRQNPERLPLHWLYVLLCGTACVTALWKFAHPNWTLTILIAMPLLAALAYVPYRVIPSRLRLLLQLVLTGAIGIWMIYRVRNGIPIDKTLVEVLAGTCLIFLMAQHVRDYGYLLTLSVLLLIYGALLPRTIYLWCLFLAFAIILSLLYGNRLRQLAAAPALRNPPRIVRRNWHIYALHLGLVVLGFMLLFPRFPTELNDTRGLFNVSFLHDKDQILLPPDLQRWFQSEEVHKDETAQQIIRDPNPDTLSLNGTPMDVKDSTTSVTEGGGSGSELPGRDLVFQVKSPLKLYHVAQLYDHYDGTRWTLSDELKKSRGLGSSWGQFRNVTVNYTIHKWLSPKLYSPYRPVLFEPRNAQLSFGTLKTSLYNAELQQDTYPGLPFCYVVTSALSTDRLLAQSLEGDNAPPKQLWEEKMPPEHYLQLPEEKISPRLKTLAKTLTRNCRDDYEKAIRLRDFLRDSFTYEQLAQPVPDGKESVDYFLYELKKGHCEYFASSLAVLARLAGMPARIATGFSPGDYNTLLNVFEIYEYHGHAWTQIFIPEYGWLTMDATPPGQIQSRTTPIGLGQLRDPFGDEWRITPPELTSQTLETLKNLYMKQLRDAQTENSKTAEVLMQMSRIQDDIRERVRETYQATAAKDPTQPAPETKTLRMRMREVWGLLRSAAGQLVTLVRTHTGAAALLLLLIPVVIVLGRIGTARLHRYRMRRRVVRDFAAAREHLELRNYRDSVLSSYRAARTLLTLARLPRRRGEELLAYATRLAKQQPELGGAPESVFLAFYAAEYSIEPISREVAVLTLRPARALCRLLVFQAKDCRELYARVDKIETRKQKQRRPNR